MDATFARAGASAGAIITDQDGQVLLVNPTYKPGWNLPGGHVDAGETPHTACVRELHEELGLELQVPSTPLAIAWMSTPGRPPHLYVVFDGGQLAPEQCAAISLQASELSAFGFFSPDTADPAVIPPAGLPLWRAATAAHRDGGTIYLEIGP